MASEDTQSASATANRAPHSFQLNNRTDYSIVWNLSYTHSGSMHNTPIIAQSANTVKKWIPLVHDVPRPASGSDNLAAPTTEEDEIHYLLSYRITDTKTGDTVTTGTATFSIPWTRTHVPNPLEDKQQLGFDTNDHGKSQEIQMEVVGDHIADDLILTIEYDYSGDRRPGPNRRKDYNFSSMVVFNLVSG